jgi:hypothetical protein
MPREEPHGLRRRRVEQGRHIIAHDVRGRAPDVDGGQLVAESPDPPIEPSTTGAQPAAEPVVDVLQRRRPVGAKVGRDGPRTGVVEVGDARPARVGVSSRWKVCCPSRGDPKLMSPCHVNGLMSVTAPSSKASPTLRAGSSPPSSAAPTAALLNRLTAGVVF